MADMTAACVLKHRQLLTCRRGTLGASIADKLAVGGNTSCLEYKMKVADGLLQSICSYNADATLNCLTNDQVCGIIQKLYILLPEDC